MSLPHLQTLHLEHLPPAYDFHIALYHNVTNASFLHQQLLAGNTDFEYAMIDATVILSKTHVLAAAYRAVNDLLENKLRSRNIHSEIVFSLSPNQNIAQSFRLFGITPTTTSLLILKLSTPTAPYLSSSVQSHLSSSVEGENVPFTDEVLAQGCDEKKVRKVYKLGALAWSGKVGGGKKGNVVVNGEKGGVEGGMVGSERRELEVSVLGAMVLRSVTG
ncbi:related to protein cgi-121 [Rhynchosporium agropyri]|uniref:EKC/KEOPS complex subunit CGI121 n=1 Tax=Rhynchosporium agropyri TaxID=914238 RepID=A0A1E1KXP2_9HELO|nr:related to protein cgi-121 [Rhynchosporium agropyri]